MAEEEEGQVTKALRRSRVVVKTHACRALNQDPCAHL